MALRSRANHSHSLRCIGLRLKRMRRRLAGRGARVSEAPPRPRITAHTLSATESAATTPASRQQTSTPPRKEGGPARSRPSINPSQGQGSRPALPSGPAIAVASGSMNSHAMSVRLAVVVPSQPMRPNAAPRLRGRSRSRTAISSALAKQAAATVIGIPTTQMASTPKAGP